MNLLVVVDMQKDFVDGALGTREAALIVPRVAEEIEGGKYDMVLATMDTHGGDYLRTKEGMHLPVRHCIRGTQGWQIVPEVKAALEKKGAVILEKPAFGSVQLAEKVRDARPDRVTLCGLCTDICVVSNALLIQAFCPQVPVRVLKDACAGTTPERHREALDVMASCQVEIL